MGRSRNLRKRIEIWETSKVSDGFGGYTIKTIQLTQTWADIRTLPISNKYGNSPEAVGIFDPGTAIIIKVRKRKDLLFNAINQYIVYNGSQYNIETNPTNPDFNNNYIQFIASKQASKTVNKIAPIGGLHYPYTYNFILQGKAETVQKIYTDYLQRVTNNGGTLTSDLCTQKFINKITPLST